MFTYDKVKNKPRPLRALTSLDRAEFEELLKPFQAAWETYVQETSPSKQNPQRQPGGGDDRAVRGLQGRPGAGRPRLLCPRLSRQ